ALLYSGFESFSDLPVICYLVHSVRLFIALVMSSPPSSAAAAASTAQLLEENNNMRAMGTQLEQQLQAVREENHRLLQAANAATAAAAAASVSSSPRAHAPITSTSGKPKPPPITQFSGSTGMGFQVDAWLRNVKKQIDWYGVVAF